MIAKHGYIDKQYCYFVIGSLELYRQKLSVLGSGLYLKVRINWRSQQHGLAVRYSFALATSMCRARIESGALIYLLGSHNCARVTHFTSAFHYYTEICICSPHKTLSARVLFPNVHSVHFNSA